MKKLSTKITALVCIGAMLFSMVACDRPEPSGTGRHHGGDSKPSSGYRADPTDPQDPTDPTGTVPLPTIAPYSGDYIKTSDELTYPDHVATYEEVHPYHAPGTLKGDAAVKELYQVEDELLHHEISSYADVEILFKDPEKLGYTYDNISWGESGTLEDYPEYQKFYQSLIDRLLEIDYTTLKDYDRLCYDKMMFDLEETVYSCSYTAFAYYTMEFNFLVGPQTDILFVLDIFMFDTLEDAENYIELIKDIDRYYDEICEFEEERVRLGFASSDNTYEESAKSFDNLVAQKDDCFLYESFEQRVNNIPGLSSSDRDRLIKENEKVMKEVLFPEFQECADRMRALKGSGGVDAGLCAYRGGDAYYAMLNRTQTNSSTAVEESMAILDKALQDTMDEYMEIAGTGLSWYKEYMDHAYSKGDLQTNLDYLDKVTKKDFPDIPKHSYTTMEVPEVFEENFSPAAYFSYHVDTTDSNMIVINNSAVDDDFGVTVAHEAYPGHMYQTLYTRNATNHMYLNLCGSIGYKEGWATYVEYYSMRYYTDSGEVTDAMKLVRDESILGLYASTRIDYGIHVENWSLTDCVEYMDGLGFQATEDSFKEFYVLVLTDPAYYTKYGMGYLWTQKTMDDMHAKHPNATDFDIHKAYLDSLTGTFEQINSYMDGLLG